MTQRDRSVLERDVIALSALRVDLSAIGLTPGDAPGGFVPAGTAKHGRT